MAPGLGVSSVALHIAADKFSGAQHEQKWTEVSAISKGPVFRRSDGVQFVSPDDSGLVGLVRRHIKVPAEQWERYMQYRQARRGKRARPSIFGLPILFPETVTARTWMAFMLLVDLVYTAFIVPINVAFCTETYGDSVSSSCTIIDLVGGIIYTLNIMFMFQTGLVIIRDDIKVRVDDGIHVAWLYALSLRFVIDILSVIPFVYLIIVISSDLGHANPTSWIHLLSILRMVRMIRMLSISKMVTVSTASGQYKKIRFIGQYLSVPLMYTVLLMYLIVVVVNLQACLLVLEAYLQPEGTLVFWDSVSFVDTWHMPRAYQYYFALYWVITTATGTGYGDVSPKNTTEQALANVNMVIGVLMFGMLVGAVSNGLTRASAAAHKMYMHRKKVAEVEEWLSARNLDRLDPALKEEVEAYYYQFWQGKNQTSTEAAILSELPAHLKDYAQLTITRPLVAQMPAFAGLPSQLQSLLAGNLRPVTYAPGEIIALRFASPQTEEMNEVLLGAENSKFGGEGPVQAMSWGLPFRATSSVGRGGPQSMAEVANAGDEEEADRAEEQEAADMWRRPFSEAAGGMERGEAGARSMRKQGTRDGDRWTNATDAGSSGNSTREQLTGAWGSLQGRWDDLKLSARSAWGRVKSRWLRARREPSMQLAADASVHGADANRDRMWYANQYLNQCGNLHASTWYADDFVRLRGPCLVAASVMLADDIPTCQQRLCTYRAVTTCKTWELRISDLWPLMKQFPHLKAHMLGFMRDRLNADLTQLVSDLLQPPTPYWPQRQDTGDTGGAGDGDGTPYPERLPPEVLTSPHNWVELPAVIIPALKSPGVQPVDIQQIIDALAQADIESGEVASVMATLAEACCVQPWDLSTTSTGPPPLPATPMRSPHPPIPPALHTRSRKALSKMSAPVQPPSKVPSHPRPLNKLSSRSTGAGLEKRSQPLPGADGRHDNFNPHAPHHHAPASRPAPPAAQGLSQSVTFRSDPTSVDAADSGQLDGVVETSRAASAPAPSLVLPGDDPWQQQQRMAGGPARAATAPRKITRFAPQVAVLEEDAEGHDSDSNTPDSTLTPLASAAAGGFHDLEDSASVGGSSSKGALLATLSEGVAFPEPEEPSRPLHDTTTPPVSIQTAPKLSSSSVVKADQGHRPAGGSPTGSFTGLPSPLGRRHASTPFGGSTSTASVQQPMTVVASQQPAAGSVLQQPVAALQALGSKSAPTACPTCQGQLCPCCGRALGALSAPQGTQSANAPAAAATAAVAGAAPAFLGPLLSILTSQQQGAHSHVLQEPAQGAGSGSTQGAGDSVVQVPRMSGAALSRTLLGPQAVANRAGLWRERVRGGDLSRSSRRIGETPVDRYNSLGACSIPFQQVYTYQE